MDFEKDFCPVVKVDGFIEKGKQFDIEINMPEDNRNAIFGVIKDCFKEPVEDAVVKLIELTMIVEKKKENQFLTHSQTKMENLFLVLFVLTKNTKYNFGLTK